MTLLDVPEALVRRLESLRQRLREARAVSGKLMAQRLTICDSTRAYLDGDCGDAVGIVAASRERDAAPFGSPNAGVTLRLAHVRGTETALAALAGDLENFATRQLRLHQRPGGGDDDDVRPLLGVLRSVLVAVEALAQLGVVCPSPASSAGPGGPPPAAAPASALAPVLKRVVAELPPIFGKQRKARPPPQSLCRAVGVVCCCGAPPPSRILICCVAAQCDLSIHRKRRGLSASSKRPSLRPRPLHAPESACWCRR